MTHHPCPREGPPLPAARLVGRRGSPAAWVGRRAGAVSLRPPIIPRASRTSGWLSPWGSRLTLLGQEFPSAWTEEGMPFLPGRSGDQEPSGVGGSSGLVRLAWKPHGSQASAPPLPSPTRCQMAIVLTLPGIWDSLEGRMAPPPGPGGAGWWPFLVPLGSGSGFSAPCQAPAS